MRLSFSRGEILGKRIYTLVDVRFAGMTVRLSTHALVISSSDGDLRYTGTCEPIVISEEVTLFALAATPVSVPVTAWWPVDVVGLVRRGHALGGCVAEISHWVEGTSYEQRAVRLRGRLSDPVYGPDGFVSCSIEENLYDDPAVVPPAGWSVEVGKFSGLGATAALLGAEDIGLEYPIAFGYPGRDPQSPSGWITGGTCPWMDKATSWHRALVSYGHIAAGSFDPSGDPGPRVWVNHDDYTVGIPFLVTLGYDDAGVPISYIDKSTGGDWYAGHLGFEETNVDPSFRASPSQSLPLFLGIPEGGGVVGRNGRVVRKAGDVMEFILDFSNVPIDRGAFAVAAAELTAFNIDCSLDSRCTVWEFLGERLLPLLPVSLCSGPAGLYPVVWKPDATADDAVAHIDADRDVRIEVAESVEVDTTQVANEFTLRYGYSRRADTYTYEARLGAEYIPATNKARATFIRGPNVLGGGERITVEAREAGLGGQGILVEMVPSSGLAVTDSASTYTVSLAFDDLDTTQGIANEFQTSSIVNAPDSNSTVAWDVATGAIVDETQTLVLADNAVLPHPLCAASQAQLRDDERRDTGKRPWTGETMLLCDKASAYAVLGWKVAAFALPRRRVTMRAPMNEWGWLRRGNVVTFTRARLGFSRHVAIVEALEWESEGMLGIRLAVIDNPARDAFAAA